MNFNPAQFKNVPIDYAALMAVLADYRSPKDKVAALEKNGLLIRLKKGLYAVSPKTSQYKLSTALIANHLYGPSYLSLQSALSFYGMIPERVYTVSSVTVKRTKHFATSLGNFEYYSVPQEYYSIGITQKTTEEGHTFLVASPEKAICDLIQITSGLRLQSVKAMQAYLEDDMRMDLSVFEKYNTGIVKQCIETGKKKPELTHLLNLLER